MIKRFPSRNHRSKGIKVKHVLQVFLLLGVCFWLIYQVKHNHDKKKEFDKKEVKLSVSTQTDPIPKLGRKDLLPGKHDESQNEKHEEDEHIEEDEENKHDHEEQEDGSKHETEEHEDDKHEGREQNKQGAEEREEDENKSEDEGRGVGDDEIDENDQEKSEVDTTDRDDEFLDEEKEKEQEPDEKENGNGDEEKGGLVENHDNHEAREEHYKGDDASSAVAHDTHATSTETETVSLENSDVNSEMNITKSENEATYSDESFKNQNASDLRASEGDVIDEISSNETAVKETGNNTLSNPVDDSSFLNKTTSTNSESHLEEQGSNLTVATTGVSSNLTGAGNDTTSSSEQNKTVLLAESDQAQSTTNNTTITEDVKIMQTEGLEQSGSGNSEEKLHTSDSAETVKTENGDAAAGESSNLAALNVTENPYRNERSESDSSESGNSQGNNETSETQNADATKDETSKGNTQTNETDETSDSSSANETLDSAELDAIDSSDSRIHEDAAEVRTDLDTLPDIRNEVDDETAAE